MIRRNRENESAFFLPENWFIVRRALAEGGRTDLIGAGPECLIQENPPKEALAARRRGAEVAIPRRGKGARDQAGADSRSKHQRGGSRRT